LRAQALAGSTRLAAAGLVLLLLLAGACIWLGSTRTGDSPVGTAKKHDGLFPIGTRDGFGYIDRTGKVIIEPQYKLAAEFSEGLAAVYAGGEWVEDKGYGRKVPKGGKFGYIDTTGKLVIEARFDLAERFSEGLAAVNLGGRWHPGPPGGMGPPPPPPGGKWGFVDKTGRMVIETRFEGFNPSIGYFSEGLALIADAGYVDRDGRVVIKGIGGGRFSEGLAWTVGKIADGYKYGFIDKKGQTVIRPQFDQAAFFREGLAPVQVGAKWGFIDAAGRMVIKPQFDHANLFTEGLAAVRVGDWQAGRWGYVDRRGHLAIKPQFETAGGFTEGLAVAWRDGRAGFIDKTGKFAVEPKFTSAGSFLGGLARVDGGYIDKIGKFVWKPAEAEAKQDGLPGH
jgi:hypothetical protein